MLNEETDEKEFIKEPTDNSKIEDIRTEREKAFSNNINRIQLRQDEIMSYILTSEQTVKHLEMLVGKEMNAAQPDYNKITNMRKAISNNVELLVKLYDTYKGFEDLRFKNETEITNTSYKFTHLIEIAIRQLDDKLNKFSGDDVFMQMMLNMQEALKGNNKGSLPALTEARAELEDDGELKL